MIKFATKLDMVPTTWGKGWFSRWLLLLSNSILSLVYFSLFISILILIWIQLIPKVRYFSSVAHKGKGVFFPYLFAYVLYTYIFYLTSFYHGSGFPQQKFHSFRLLLVSYFKLFLNALSSFFLELLNAYLLYIFFGRRLHSGN